MSKAWTSAALLAASLVGAASIAAAHGGSYKGPNDTVPPVGTPPAPPTPGGNPSPGTTPPGTPSTPGSKAPTTSPPTPPTANPPGARTTTGPWSRPNGGSSGDVQWEVWWEANDDSFLALKQRLRLMGVATQSSGLFTGRSAGGKEARASRTTADDERRMRAALLAALDSNEGDIVDAALIALARMSTAEQADLILPAITKALGHPTKSVRESAALALGIVGAPEAIATLRELLLDTPRGRSLTGSSGAVQDLTRAFAAASLGMIGSPEVVTDLKRVVVDESLHANADVKSLAVFALGLVKGGHDRIVPFLEELMGDRSLELVVRAQAPIALARLAEQPGGADAVRAALPSAVARFTDDKSDLDLERSLAVALGRIVTMDDLEPIAALQEAAARAKDEQTRHFAMMALADVGARDPEPDLHADGHRRLSEFFRVSLAQPKPRTQRPYAALALAVHGRNQHLDRALQEAARSKLLETYLEESNPSYKAACAVALGLLGATESKHDLSEAFLASHDPPFRGYLAVGMGLMLARDRADDLRALLVTKGAEPRMKLQLARALGLLGDPRAVDVLIEQLASADTISETASTAQALGLIGDRSAVAPLIALLQDARQVPVRRGFAAVALGLLAEKSELPWNAAFTAASNYRARTPAFREIFDIL